MLDEALGYQAYSATGGADTITIPDGTTGVARSIYIQLNGTGGGSVAVPTTKTKMYFVFNNTASAITFKVTGQTGVSIPAAAKIALVSNGTDIIVAQNYFAALTLGAALPVLSGGTGVTTSTGTGNTVLSASPTLTGTVAGASLSLSSLTSGRVTYAGTAGLLQDSANLLFNGTTLTANTIGAFTLSGTVAGGGNQLNNVIIGTTTPLAGAFTTLSTTGNVGVGTTATSTFSENAGSNLVIGAGAASAGLTIFPGSTGVQASLNFAKSTSAGGDQYRGNITYSMTSDTMFFGTSAVNRLVLSSTGLAVTGTLSATGNISCATANTSFQWISANNNVALLGTGGSLLFYTGTAGYVNTMTLDSSGNLLVGVATANANGGVLQLKSGITFPATAVDATDANTLDDYEEGTWSPVAVFSGGNGTLTYGYRAGLYTKIGRAVNLTCRFGIVKGTAAGNYVIGGLPFTIGNGQAYYGGAAVAGVIRIGKAGNVVTIRTLINTATLEVLLTPFDSLNASASLTAADIDAGATADTSDLFFSMTYFV